MELTRDLKEVWATPNIAVTLLRWSPRKHYKYSHVYVQDKLLEKIERLDERLWALKVDSDGDGGYIILLKEYCGD